ncbi:hypothetical protein AB1Y20_014655 [Prymnesium parvum]|uniref:Methyltransferase domain-containing protein n=1 Tax=Prymnesium parvum TaxID=97485 RepID=A0AB34ICQ3_PRYPA
MLAALSVALSPPPPSSDQLYRLLHLGGFPGDLAFYRRATAAFPRVLELGCGDGRLAEALCAAPPDGSPPTGREYVGVERSAAFVRAARRRLDGHGARVLHADFLAPLGEARRFDAAVLCANALFATARHGALLARCAEALVPSGRLVLDVYHAAPWHEAALATARGDGKRAEGEGEEEGEEGVEGEGEGEEEEEEEGEEEEERGEEGEGGELRGEEGVWRSGADGEGAGREEEEAEMLVVVQDEHGREYRVYELEPLVDARAQQITCRYDFVSSGGAVARETLLHHYLLPEQLIELLSEKGFEIDSIYGDFYDSPFSPGSSEHLIVVARLR